MTRRHDTWATKDAPVGVEIYYGAAWHDITADLSGAGFQVSRKEDSTELTATLDNSGNDYTPDNPNCSLWGLIGRQTPIRAWAEAGTPRLLVTAGLGSGATTPDSAALSLSTDVELTIDVDLPNWRTSTMLLGKWDSGTDKSYYLGVDDDGYLWLQWSTDGSAQYGTASTAVVPAETGRLTVRGYLDMNDGSGNRAYTFSWSTGGVAGTFTQLGDTVPGGAASTIHDGTADLVVGDDPAYARMVGVVHAATVRGTAGGALVASPDFTAQASGTSSFDDAQSNTWTVQTGASLTDRHYRFTGEVASWKPRHGLKGPTSATTDIVAAGVRRRLGQGRAPLRSPYTRAHTAKDPQVAALVAYWPMEDGSNADVYGSGLPNGPAQVFVGSPTLASDSTSFACSAPLTVTDAAWSTFAPIPNYADTGEIQVRWLLNLPAGAVSAETALMQFTCNGSAAKWRLTVDTSGNLRLYAYGPTDATLLTSGPIAFAVNDKTLRFHVSVVQNGADIDFLYSVYTPGSTYVYYQSGTLAGQTIGRCTYIGLAPYAAVTGATFGHLSLQAAETGNGSELMGPLDAFNDESAAERVQRLAGEHAVAYTRVGGPDAQLLGYQTTSTLLDLLAGAADSDTGLITEPRDGAGLAYRSGNAMRTQFPRCEIAWEQNLLWPFQPAPDDRAVRNKVTVTRAGGASATSEVTTGTMSTLAPEDGGIGLFEEALTRSLASDSQPRHLAGWATHIGTVAEPRWPQIGVDLAHPTILADTDLTRDLLDLDLGDRLLVTDPPGWLAADDVDQLIVGYTEQVSPTNYKITFDSEPARAHKVLVYDLADCRYSGAGTVTAEVLDTTETGVDITAPTGVQWGHDDGDYLVDCEGEWMLVTAVSGSAPNYTFTVQRSVNGVVASHSSGVGIDLAEPSYWGQ